MKFTNLLVPVIGKPIDDQAVQLAGQIARQTKAHVLAAHVIEVSRAMPLETESAAELHAGEMVLEHADAVARKLGVRVDTELLQARVAGPVIVELANERGIDLIIMGVPYRSPLEEFRLGTTVRHILRNALCQVWLCREQAPSSELATAKK